MTSIACAKTLSDTQLRSMHSFRFTMRPHYRDYTYDQYMVAVKDLKPNGAPNIETSHNILIPWQTARLLLCRLFGENVSLILYAFVWGFGIQ